MDGFGDGGKGVKEEGGLPGKDFLLRRLVSKNYFLLNPENFPGNWCLGNDFHTSGNPAHS